MVKRVFKLIVPLAGLLVFGATVLYLTNGESGGTQANDGNDNIVHLLDGADQPEGDYALILHEFVTGAGSRLIEDEAELSALAGDLWYRSQWDPASVLGQSFFTLLGMPPVEHIGTLLKDGAVEQEFFCLSVNCAQWRGVVNSDEVWGMAGLYRLHPAVGSPVDRSSQSFTDYGAYLQAHAAVADDHTRFYARTNGAMAAPPDDGQRGIRVSLPSEIVQVSPAERLAEANGEEAEPLRRLAEEWLEGTGGTVDTVSITTRQPLWVLYEDGYVYEAGGTVGLRGVSFNTRQIRISVPKDQVGAVHARIEAAQFPPPDRSLLVQPLVQTFVAQNIDTACLPQCGDVEDTQLFEDMDVFVEPDPTWVLELWEPIP